VARECSHDVAFIRQYLSLELCEKLGLFSYSEKKKIGITIDEIYNEEGWESIRESLIMNIGTNSIPVIYIEEIENDGTLILRHEHDGRDLDLNHADEVVNHVRTLWGSETKLFSLVENELWEI